MDTVQNTETVSSHIRNANTFTIKDFFNLCLDHWKWFAISVFTALSLAVAYLVVNPPVYTRSAEILIKDDDKGGGGGLASALGGLADFGLFGSSMNVYNELGAIQSSFVMYNVVKRMHLDVSYIVKGIRDKDLYGKDRPITVQFTDFTDEDEGGAVVDLKKNGEVTLSGFYKNKDDFDTEIKGRVNSRIKTPIGTLYVAATPYLSNVKEDMTIHVDKADPTVAAEDCSKQFTSVVSSRDAAIIKMTYQDVSKQRAVDVLNEILTVYKEEWMNDKNQVSMSSSRFIEDRLLLLEKELGIVDNDISQFKSKNLMPDIEVAAGMYMKNANAAGLQRTELTNQLFMVKYLKDFLRDKSQADQALPMGMVPLDKSMGDMFMQYNTLLLQRNKIAAGNSENHPYIADYDAQLASMRKAILASLDNAMNQLKIEIDGIKGAENENNEKIASSPTKATQLLSSERQQKVKQQLYLYLLQKREENQLSQAFTAYNLRVLTPPMGRKKATFPVKRNVLTVAFLLGMLIPAITLFIRERSITTIRGRKDIEGLKVPYLGEIPLYKPRRKQDAVNRILIQPKKRNIINEAFRVMRTNLEFMAGSYHAKTFLVTSANPGSGKTFTTINMAAVYALKGKKVALLDLDLRKASLSLYVNSPKNGVSTYLSEQTDNWKSMMVKHPDSQGLDILPCGTMPPNPTELLANGRINRLMEELRAEYDYIFMDCAPIEIVADTSILAPLADMSIFIIRNGLLEREMLPIIDGYYTGKKLKNMALVLNGTDIMTGRYNRNGFGYGYGYGGYTEMD